MPARKCLGTRVQFPAPPLEPHPDSIRVRFFFWPRPALTTAATRRQLVRAERRSRIDVGPPPLMRRPPMDVPTPVRTLLDWHQGRRARRIPTVTVLAGPVNLAVR